VTSEVDRTISARLAGVAQALRARAAKIDGHHQNCDCDDLAHAEIGGVTRALTEVADVLEKL
jgi:hypothetical protein